METNPKPSESTVNQCLGRAQSSRFLLIQSFETQRWPKNSMMKIGYSCKQRPKGGWLFTICLCQLGVILPETNSSPLKTGRFPNRKGLSSNHPFSGASCWFRGGQLGVTQQFFSTKKPTSFSASFGWRRLLDEIGIAEAVVL